MGLKSRRTPAAMAASPSEGSATGSVDGYLRSLPASTREVATALRRLIRRVMPGASEGIKWNVPVFELEVPVCYLAAHADYVRLGFYRGAELTDPTGLLEGTGARLRHVKVAPDEPLAQAEVEALIRGAAALARDG
jgi:hypothetical protein